MWNLNHSDECFNIMDLKPPEADGYVEVAVYNECCELLTVL